MYINFSEAVEELKKRQENKNLVNKIDEVLGKNCPIPRGNYGFMCRQVGTCKLEDVQFVEKCNEAGLEPVWLEYTADRFLSINPEKMSLVRLRVFLGLGRNGGPKTETYPLVKNITKWENEPINCVITDKGESLISLHHKMQREVLGVSEVQRIDISNWLSQLGKAEKYYYPYLLSMGINGILFDNFHCPYVSNLRKFCKGVVEPSLNKINQNELPFPLIVQHPIASSKEEEKTYSWYPSKVLSFLNER